MNRREIDAQLPTYEGLLVATASLIERELHERGWTPPAELGFEDIRQRLRIKVWKALESYDKARAKQSLRNYVFQCVTNEKKDILKAKRRGEDHIEAQAPEGASAVREAFELRYLSVRDEQLFLSIESRIELPATLTDVERMIVGLLYEEWMQIEIQAELELSKNALYAHLDSIKEKMADWRLSSSERAPGPSAPLPRPLHSPAALASA